MKGYIYRIDIGPRYYYGQTKHIKTREKDHLRKLRRGSHANPCMQNSFDKYGSFSFVVIQIVLDKEYIIAWQVSNLVTGAGNSRGIHHD